MRSSWLHGSVAGSALLVAACGESSIPIDLGQAQLPVVSGEDSHDDQNVVRVFTRPPPNTQPARTCTGTLIAPNLVVTALHCLSPIVGDQLFSCSIDGQLESPPNGSLGTPIEAQYVNVQSGFAFTLTPDAVGAVVLHTRSTQICQNDLAFVVLDRDLDFPISPVRLDTRPTVGEVVSVIGYGYTQDPPPPPDEYTQRRRRDGVRITAVELEGREKTRPRTFTLGESVCVGDSGGAAFSEAGAVLGVYSTNTAGCVGIAGRNAFTMLSSFRPLALEAFAAAGAEPWIEGELPPGTVIDAGTTPTPGPDAEPPEPEPTLDGGNLQPLDSTPDDIPPGPPGGSRVDSGFCALMPHAARDSGALPGAFALLAAALLRRARRR